MNRQYFVKANALCKGTVIPTQHLGKSLTHKNVNHMKCSRANSPSRHRELYYYTDQTLLSSPTLLFPHLLLLLLQVNYHGFHPLQAPSPAPRPLPPPPRNRFWTSSPSFVGDGLTGDCPGRSCGDRAADAAVCGEVKTTGIPLLLFFCASRLFPSSSHCTTHAHATHLDDVRDHHHDDRQRETRSRFRFPRSISSLSKHENENDTRCLRQG